MHLPHRRYVPRPILVPNHFCIFADYPRLYSTASVQAKHANFRDLQMGEHPLSPFYLCGRPVAARVQSASLGTPLDYIWWWLYVSDGRGWMYWSSWQFWCENSLLKMAYNHCSYQANSAEISQVQLKIHSLGSQRWLLEFHRYVVHAGHANRTCRRHVRWVYGWHHQWLARFWCSTHSKTCYRCFDTNLGWGRWAKGCSRWYTWRLSGQGRRRHWRTRGIQATWRLAIRDWWNYVFLQKHGRSTSPKDATTCSDWQSNDPQVLDFKVKVRNSAAFLTWLQWISSFLLGCVLSLECLYTSKLIWFLIQCSSPEDRDLYAGECSLARDQTRNQLNFSRYICQALELFSAVRRRERSTGDLQFPCFWLRDNGWQY